MYDPCAQGYDGGKGLLYSGPPCRGGHFHRYVHRTQHTPLLSVLVRHSRTISNKNVLPTTLTRKNTMAEKACFFPDHRAVETTTSIAYSIMLVMATTLIKALLGYPRQRPP